MRLPVLLSPRAFWPIFGAIFLLVGAVFLLFGAMEAREEARYERERQVVEGMVLAKHVRRATANEGTEYRVSYRFSTDDGRTIEASSSIGIGAWEELVERGPILIEYLPAEPSTNRVAGTGGWAAVLITLTLGAILGLVGAGTSLAGWRRIRLERRLRLHGLAAEGKVVAVEPTNVHLNRERLWRLRYEYSDSSGRRHVGQSGYRSWGEAEGWQPGDIGGVRYDADDPELSIWTGSLMAASAAE
jgi:hypothetical protein